MAFPWSGTDQGEYIQGVEYKEVMTTRIGTSDLCMHTGTDQGACRFFKTQQVPISVPECMCECDVPILCRPQQKETSQC